MKLYELQKKLSEIAEIHGDGIDVIDGSENPVEIVVGHYANGTPVVSLF